MSPDAELCDATYCQLEVAGEEPTDEVYTTIVLAWAASNAISNGGFEFLFEGAYFQRDPRYARTVAAYERIGATACAGALREAIAWLGTPAPADQAERMARAHAVAKDERWRVASACWAARGVNALVSASRRPRCAGRAWRGWSGAGRPRARRRGG